MTIAISRSHERDYVEGVDCPPFSTGLCMACQKQTHGYFGGKTKVGLWVCHPCKLADTKAVKK